MSYRSLMVIGAVLAAGFGLALVLATEPMLSLYGLRVEPSGILIGRLLGVAFIGFGFLAWLVRNAEQSLVRLPVLQSFLGTDFVAFVVALIGQVSGIMNQLGWSVVAVFLLMSLAWAYLLIEEGRSGEKK